MVVFPFIEAVLFATIAPLKVAPAENTGEALKVLTPLIVCALVLNAPARSAVASGTCTCGEDFPPALICKYNKDGSSLGYTKTAVGAFRNLSATSALIGILLVPIVAVVAVSISI